MALRMCFSTVVGCSAGFASAPAVAEDLIPPVTAASATDGETTDTITTHPLIRLTPEQSELVKLDRAATSVIVGNPAHLSVLLDTPTLMVLVPRIPGATSLTVLDDVGEVIMQRHVIVGSPKQNYVRVRRSCANAGRGARDCQATSVYFCPDMCHEVTTSQMGDRVTEPRVPEEVPGGGATSLTTEEDVPEMDMDQFEEFMRIFGQ